MTRYVNLINGTEVPMTAAEITARKAEEAEWNNSNNEFTLAMEDLRAKRNKLLADTDYTVLQDSTYTDEQVAEWVIYRQALRDITNNLTTVADVEAVVFPTKPE